MNITLSSEYLHESLERLKGNKACCPDNRASALVPSLMSVFEVSREINIVPKTWKCANVSPIFKKDDVTDKQNYHPVSLLCIPGKLMESNVASTITSHVADHGLAHSRQWAHRKGHSTELLLVKMVENWRKALDGRK